MIETQLVLVDAIEFFLRTDNEFSFVGAVSRFADGPGLARRTQPDVLLLNTELPDGNGLDLITPIREVSPKTRLIIINHISDRDTVLQAIDLGLAGLMQKNYSLGDLLYTIRKVYQDEIVIPSNLVMGLLRQPPKSKVVEDSAGNLWEKLTDREIQILTCLAAGMSGDKIARELNIAPLTVRTHVRNLISKLGVHSRLEAVAFGLKNRLISNATGFPNFT